MLSCINRIKLDMECLLEKTRDRLQWGRQRGVTPHLPFVNLTDGHVSSAFRDLATILSAGCTTINARKKSLVLVKLLSS